MNNREERKVSGLESKSERKADFITRFISHVPDDLLVDPAQCIGFPDNKMVVSRKNSNLLTLWDVESGKLENKKTMPDEINFIVQSKQGLFTGLFAATRTQITHLHADLSDCRGIRPWVTWGHFSLDYFSIAGYAFVSGKYAVATSTLGKMLVKDHTKTFFSTKYGDETNFTSSIRQLTQVGHQFLIGLPYGGQMIFLWHLEDNKPSSLGTRRISLNAHFRPIILSQNRFIIANSFNIYCYQIDDLKDKQEPKLQENFICNKEYSSSITALCSLSDQEHFAVALESGELEIWNATLKSCVYSNKELFTKDDHITHLTLNPTDGALMFLSKNGRRMGMIRDEITDALEAGKVLVNESSFSNPVAKIVFSYFSERNYNHFFDHNLVREVSDCTTDKAIPGRKI